MPPLVSIVMPAYNAEKYIGESIESVLSQTYANIELIIVEDCSTDGTLNVIKQYADERITLEVNTKNRGIAFSTNRGIELSKGKYIALLDDDDMATPDRIELQVNYLETHSEVDILGGWTETIDGYGNHLNYYPEPRSNPKYIKALLLFTWWEFENSTTMIRRQFWEDSGLRYEDNCCGLQDLRFFMKASKVGTISAIHNLVLYKRNHDSNESKYRHEKFAKERDAAYRKFRIESLKESGIYLEQDEYDTLNNLLSDLNFDKKKSDLETLYEIFRKILIQVKQKTDFYKEAEHVCKRLLRGYLMNIDSFFDI